MGCAARLNVDKDAMGYLFVDYDNNGILNTGDRIYMFYDKNKDGIPDKQVVHRLIITHEIRELEKLIDRDYDGYWDIYYKNFDAEGLPIDSTQVHIKIMKEDIKNL